LGATSSGGEPPASGRNYSIYITKQEYRNGIAGKERARPQKKAEDAKRLEIKGDDYPFAGDRSCHVN